MTRRATIGALDADDAFIAVLIAAMDASGHVSPAEAERAHHIIWSMRRFHDREGGEVERRIERMRELIGEHGAAPVLEAGAKLIPERLRSSAFAVAADLVLVDGRMERLEAKFLRTLAADLELDATDADRILDVIRIKNSA
jgi:tellurite resistance protein